jgi:uncharacterized membrane protein YdjX (TVP38/TMEM64 family)
VRNEGHEVLSMIPELANISLRKAVLGFLSLVGVTAIMLVILTAAGTERLQHMVTQMGPWAPAVYIALKALTYIVAPLSGSPLHVSAGALFGLGYGTLYSLAGDVLGGCANFWLSRLLGRRMVVRLVGQQGMSRIDGFYRQLGGWRALLCARLFLSSVYDFISYAAGLTSLAFRRYLVITAVGGVVPTLLFVAIGASVAENRWMLPLAYGGLAMLCLVPLVLHRRVPGASRPD